MGKAKRAHHFSHATNREFLVGTALARLCPPYSGHTSAGSRFAFA
jgi:hypothetical protein